MEEMLLQIQKLTKDQTKTKKEKILQVAKEIIEQMPPMPKMMLQANFSLATQYLTNIDDSKIDDTIDSLIGILLNIKE